MSSYDTALICENGHLICNSLENFPDDAQKHCSKCGTRTLSNCPSCNEKLRGYYNSEDPDFPYIKTTEVESYCYSCGKPYPWTSSALESTILLIQEDDELKELQKTQLIETLPDLVVETPKTNLALVRIKKAMIAGGKFTAEGIRQFVIDFGCELAKKGIGL